MGKKDLTVIEGGEQPPVLNYEQSQQAADRNARSSLSLTAMLTRQADAIAKLSNSLSDIEHLANALQPEKSDPYDSPAVTDAERELPLIACFDSQLNTLTNLQRRIDKAIARLSSHIA